MYVGLSILVCVGVWRIRIVCSYNTRKVCNHIVWLMRWSYLIVRKGCQERVICPWKPMLNEHAGRVTTSCASFVPFVDHFPSLHAHHLCMHSSPAGLTIVIVCWLEFLSAWWANFNLSSELLLALLCENENLIRFQTTFEIACTGFLSNRG